jgi:hypothetical protein
VKKHSIVALVVLAALYTGLNAFKPPHIDDAAYFYFAHQIAAHPLDPYGFSLLWYDEPNRANDILAPPVVPAWWALQLRVFGDSVSLGKLGLLPWAVALAAVLYELFRRFARGLEMPLTWLTVLSPALLPSLNFMLDVPALALSLAAVCLFLRACDRNSHGLAIVSGLVAGLAAETKFTGFLAPGVMLLAAATRKRWSLWPGAAAAAAQVFVAWEFLTAVLYGQSHFLNAFRNGGGLRDRVLLIVPLFDHLGGVLPAVVLLALAALGARRRWLVAALGTCVLGFSLVATLGDPFEGVGSPEGVPIQLPSGYQIAHTLFFLLGLGSAGVIGWVLLRSFTGAGGSDEGGMADPERRDLVFLALWLVLDLAGYFMLSPFPAVRRVLGPTVVLTLLVGRYATAALVENGRRRGVGAALVVGVGLGLAFFALDLREALVQREAAKGAAAWVREHGGGRVWYVGHWGWQLDAELSGMEPVVAEYDPPPGHIPFPPPSRLKAGDWLVVPDDRVYRQDVYLDTEHLREEVLLRYADGVPLRTVPCYYLGVSPLEHHAGDRLTVRVFRVTDDFTPQLCRGK